MRQIRSLFQLLVSFSRTESFPENTVLEINPLRCHKGLWLQPTRRWLNSVCFLSPFKHKEDATKRLWIGVLQEAANSGLNVKFSYFTGIISCPNLVRWMGTWNENMRKGDLRRHYTSVSWYEALRNRWLCAASIMLREWKHEYISSSSRAHAALHFIMDGPLRKRSRSRSATPLRLQRVADPVQGGRPDNEMCSRWTRCTAEIIDFCAFDKNTTD